MGQIFSCITPNEIMIDEFIPIHTEYYIKYIIVEARNKKGQILEFKIIKDDGDKWKQVGIDIETLKYKYYEDLLKFSDFSQFSRLKIFYTVPYNLFKCTYSESKYDVIHNVEGVQFI